MAYAIEATNILKSYGKFDFIESLRHLELTLPPAALALVVGANGCGKTTLLRLLSGVSDFQSGSLRVFGQNPKEPRCRAKVSVQFDVERSFYWRLNAFDNLAFFLGLRGISKRSLQSALAAWSWLVSDELLQRRFGDLSLGQKKRVAIARALIAHSELVLLDDPAAGLDGTTQKRLAESIKEATKKGRTVLITAPSLDDALIRDCVVVPLGVKP